MGRAFRILRRAATVGSALVGVAVLAVWGWSFRAPVVAAYAWRGEQCQVVIDTGRATIDNAPQVVADAKAGVDARAARVAKLVEQFEQAQRDLYRSNGLVRAARREDDRMGTRRETTRVMEEAQAALMRKEDDTFKELSRARRAQIVTRPAWSDAAPPYVPPLAAVPLLVPVALAALRELRRCDRRWAGQCVACGYDLRASPERCPECGAVAAAANGDAEAQGRGGAEKTGDAGGP